MDSFQSLYLLLGGLAALLLAGLAVAVAARACRDDDPFGVGEAEED